METKKKVVYSKEVKLRILDRLTWADHFEVSRQNRVAVLVRVMECTDVLIPSHQF